MRQSGTIISKLGWLFSYLIAPTSHSKDQARKELILNIIMVGSIVLALIATVVSWISFLLSPVVNPGDFIQSALQTTAILVLFILGLLLSKRGFYKAVSIFLILLYFWITTMSALQWGASFPQGLLIYALTIVIAGILIGPNFAVVYTSLVTAILLTLIYFQQSGLLTVRSYWKSQPTTLQDGIIYGVTLSLITLISWLYTTEMEKTLQRAQKSELALKKQRDQLEYQVEQRTQELRRTQAEKLSEVYRFVEIGRQASGIFHDLSTPLNVISLNLNQLDKTEAANAKILLKRAINGTHKLEQYIQAARRQTQNQQITQQFSLNQEIDHVMDILEHRIKETKVKVNVKVDPEVIVTGSPIKFFQLVVNLLSNAIDSYDTLNKRYKPVTLTLHRHRSTIELTVTDRGKGIPPRYLKKIFQPLFSTKGFEHGTGMGLYISKQIVEQDFHGTLSVESRLGKGSTFIAKLSTN